MRKINKRLRVRATRYDPDGIKRPYTLVVNGKHRGYRELSRMQRDYRFFSRFAECEAWDNYAGCKINDEMQSEGFRAPHELCEKSDLKMAYDYREAFNL